MTTDIFAQLHCFTIYISETLAALWTCVVGVSELHRLRAISGNYAQPFLMSTSWKPMVWCAYPVPGLLETNTSEFRLKWWLVILYWVMSFLLSPLSEPLVNKFSSIFRLPRRSSAFTLWSQNCSSELIMMFTVLLLIVDKIFVTDFVFLFSHGGYYFQIPTVLVLTVHSQSLGLYITHSVEIWHVTTPKRAIVWLPIRCAKLEWVSLEMMIGNLVMNHVILIAPIWGCS